MAETGTAQNPTDAATLTEGAATTSLLGAAADVTQTTQQQTDTAPPAIPPATPPVDPPANPPADPPKPPAEGAPEKYEFKIPEGKTYDKDLISAFEAGAKEANLAQDAAQKLLDQMAPKIQERQAEQMATIRQGWLDASKTDKEFGGVGLEQNLGVAKTALDKFGTPELNQLLVSTGLGNHPEVIRMMYKVGKAISEDNFVAGSAPARSQVDATAVLYDNTSQKEK